MENKIVEGVLYAHRPGRNTYRRDVARAFKRAFVWLTFRKWIPLELRQRLLFGVINLGRFLSRGEFRFAGGLGKGDTFENDILKLVFNATAIANIADNAASSPLTNLYCSLHTGSDPTDTASQTTNEISYTGYERVAVARTTGGWTVTGNSVSPVANIDFGQMTAGAGGTVTYGVIGTASSGAGKVLYYGTVTPNIVVSNGVIPRFPTTSTVTED